MKNLENIAEDLFNKIRGRFPSVSLGDENGQVTNITKAARFFDFEYKENDRTLGKVSVTIDEDTLSVMYSTNFVSNEDTMTQNNWYDFLKELRTFSKKRMLNFDTRNITKSNLNKRDYKFLATNRAGEEQMSESTMYGTTKTSFQKIGNAKLSIKHTEAINIESAAARSQKIGKIYIESADGEKFKYPFKHLSGARAMARHVSEGGMPFDDFGVHIVGLSEEMSKLRKFKNYMGRSAVMAESLAGYVDVVKERIATVKKTITSLQKPKFYAETFAAFEKPMMEDVPTDVSDNWIDQLTIKQFNEELADVFPYIYKLVSEATKATELGPEDLDEGIVDWIKSKWQGYQKARADDRKAYDQHLHVMQTILAQNGYDDFSIKRMVNGCLNDPRVCLYNEIREKDLEMGDMDMVVKQVGQSLNKGITSRSATVNDSFDSAADELMGQFGKQYSVVKDEEDTDGDEITLEKDEKTPLGEFILSYFDRESGQFPKGETSVLTMIEKDYGEQYINPGKAFIEAITAKFEELNASNSNMLGEAGGEEIFLDFSKELTDVERTDDTEEFTAKLSGLGFRAGSEEEIDLEGIPVNVTINATGYVQEGEFEIVSVTGDDGTQYVLDETDTWDIYNLTELFSNALATEDTNMYASQNNTVMEPTIQQDEELGDIRRLSGI